MSLERLNPRELAQPTGPYVHAVKAGKLIFISGQIATGPGGARDAAAPCRQLSRSANE